MSEKKKHQQTAMRFLAAALAASNLLGTSAAAVSLPAGYAAYSNEAFAALQGGSVYAARRSRSASYSFTGAEEQDGAYTVSKGSGNAFAVLNGQNPVKAFHMAADVTITDGNSAAFLFGVENKSDPGGGKWAGANVNFADTPSSLAHMWGLDGLNYDSGESLASLTKDESLHFDLAVSDDGSVTYEITQGENTVTMTGKIENWDGGYVGLLTFNSAAEFSNFEFEDTRLSVSGSGASQTVTVGAGTGDYFVPYSKWAGEAWDTSTKAFTLETDVELKEGSSAALVFGAKEAGGLSGGWYGANVNFEESDKTFRVFGANGLSFEEKFAAAEGLTASDKLHLKLSVKENGDFTYTYGKTDEAEKTITGTISNWNGGDVGLLTFNSGAVFSNISFQVDSAADEPTGGDTLTAGDAEITVPDNVEYVTVDQENSTVQITGSNDSGDRYVMLSRKGSSSGSGKGFSFQSDVKFDTDSKSAALVFGATADGAASGKSWYGANINFEGNGEIRVFKVDNGATDYAKKAIPAGVTAADQLRLDLKVDDEGKFIFTVYKKASGAMTALLADEVPAGYDKVEELSGTIDDWATGENQEVGLLTFNSTATFSNVSYSADTPTVNLPGQDADFIGDDVIINEDGSVIVSKTNGDHFAMYNKQTGASNGFTMEVDVSLTEGNSAALVFGADSPTNTSGWGGANFNFGESQEKIFRVFRNGDLAMTGKGDVDKSKLIHLKLDVSPNGSFTYTFGNKDGASHELKGTLPNWRGGYVGLLTFDSAASFSNFTFEDKSDFSVIDSGTVAPLPDENKVAGTDFRSLRPDLAVIDADKVLLNSSGGDHFAIYDRMTEKTKAFVLEADVNLQDGDEDILRSAALVFGIGSKKLPTLKWGGANVDTSRNGADAFRVFGLGMGDTNYDGEKGSIDYTKPLHFRLKVKENGEFIYHFGNTDTPEEDYVKRAVRGTIPNWQGGYVGLLSFKTKVEFSNIRFKDNDSHTPATGTPVEVGSGWNTNLHDLTAFGGTWESTTNGMRSDASEQDDCFLFSQVEGTDFVYSTDITFHENKGAAALMFRNQAVNNNEECYAVNLDAASRKCKLWRWSDGTDYQLMNESSPVPEADTYTLKVVAIGPWLSCYVNDILVASSGDYTLPHQYDDKGQNTVLKQGYFGLLNFSGDATFQNTYYQPLTNAFTPLLSDLAVTSSSGTVEKRTQFVPTEPITIQYVKNDASTVRLNAAAKNPSAVITITDENGNAYASGADIPVAVGKNWLTVTSKVRASDGTEAAVAYRVDVHRRQPDEVYYNEPYRGQYHYSVQDGWANDPNGMVYFNGKYHLFYQFYDDVEWGPMHWAHAVSIDLLHWTEEPIAFYPDANGAMFSGCIVADTRNESGFFDGVSGGGLVALITADGGGQRIKLAYSTDEGTTWTKVDEIAADWTDDPLADGAFRDPKVFRWENQWFMVVAGGPLRIYSSTNLREWKCETPYGDLHTECPDLYPIQLEDGTIKWVLSRGGRFYKIGDFTNRNGKWEFIPDADYQGNRDGAETNGVMNFGDDSYAAMTYFVQDFGTSANPQIPTITEINWMNTWADNYCRRVTQASGEKFNGTFNLNLDLGLTEENGKYLLTQTPVQAYESLRDTENAVVIAKTTAVDASAQLTDFQSDCYEIVAKFKPSARETVGFNVRVGGGKKTSVLYDPAQNTMTIDRSQSGRMIPNAPAFSGVDKQENVTLNADGTMDMRVFVDRACVELFAKTNTVLGANQIFPEENCLGLEVVGGSAEVELTIYPMNSIWTNPPESTVYTVTFDAAGGDVVPESMTTNTAGKLIGSLPVPVREGYTFTGWLMPNGEGVTADTVFTENTVLTAGWVKNDEIHFTVTFDANGGTVSPESLPVGGDGRLIGTLPIPIRESYTFTGWEMPDGTLVTADTLFISDTTITAGWKKEETACYTITFDANGGDVVPESMTTNTAGKLTGSLPIPVREGYTFTGWLMPNGEGVTADTVFTENTVLTAGWVKNDEIHFTVTFDANGGTVSPESLPVGGDGRLIGTLPIPIRESYTFTGWEMPDGTPVTADTLFISDTTIIAGWKQEETACYTITFDANGGTASAASQKTGTDGRLTSLPSASRSGYRFTGWYLPDGSLVTTDTVFTSAVTVTAGWTPSSSGGSTHPNRPSRPSGSDSSSDRKPSDNSGKKDPEKQDAKPAPTPAEETNRQPTDTSGYRDVPETEWFAPAVNYVTENGIMTGNGNRFSPNEKLTRGMMAQILYNIAGGSGSGSANFPDIASGDWFANAAGWAAEQGYIGGYSNGKFGPNDPITREQLAAILYRYAQANGLVNGTLAELTSFVDASATSDWAEEAVRWAVGAGLLSGKSGGRLDPAGQATRAEVAQILTNFSQNIAR